MFDREFIITLPRSSVRYDSTLAHLKDSGIYPERFDGFDSAISGLETRFTYDVDNPGTEYRMGTRPTNISLSHYVLWKCMLYMTGDSFLILEDDVRFDPDWRDHVASALVNLPQDWDILYVGSCCCEDRPRTQVKNRLWETTVAQCTHAYAIRRKSLPVLLDKCARFWAGIDIQIMMHALPHLKSFAILPRVAHQDGTEISP